jgi:hypothetical protein
MIATLAKRKKSLKKAMLWYCNLCVCHCIALNAAVLKMNFEGGRGGSSFMTILGNVSLLAGELTINVILLNGFPLLQSWRFFQRFFPSVHLYASEWPLLTPPPQSKSNIKPSADEEKKLLPHVLEVLNWWTVSP